MFRALPLFLLCLSATALGQPRLVVQTGHTEMITAVAFSPDGERVLTGSYDQTARLWEVASGKELVSFADHDEFVTTAAFSPDGEFIATGTRQAIVTLFSARTGERILRTREPGWQIYALAYTPDGSRIVTGDHNGALVTWSASTGEPLGRIDVGEMINGVAVSPDGGSVLAGTMKGSLLLFSLDTGDAIQSFEGHTKAVKTVAFSPDGSTVLSGSEDGSARLWAIGTGRQLLQFPGGPPRPPAMGSGPVPPPQAQESGVVANAVAFSPDGNLIATGHGDGSVRIWSASDGSEIRRIDGHRGWINSISFSPDGSLILSGGHDKTARLRSVATGEELMVFEGKVDTVESLDVRPGEMTLASGSGDRDHRVSLWSLTGGSLVDHLPIDRGKVEALGYSQDGAAIAAGGGNRVMTWDADTGDRLPLTIGFGHEVLGLAFASGSPRVIAGSFDGTAQVLDLATGEVHQCCSQNQAPERPTTDAVMSVASSPDGRYIAIGGRSDDYGRNYAYLWDASSGERVRIFGPVESQVSSVEFSPDGALLLGTSHGAAWIWDVSSGHVFRKLDHDGAFLTSGVWGPDGKTVVTGGRDRLVRVWDVTSGEEIRRFSGHTGQVNGIRLLAGGEIIVSASQDGTVRLWDNRNGGEMCRLVSFGDGTWAVVDDAGRFDASNGGAVDGLHWVVDGEVMALSQLKSRFYEPGLLAKVLGFNTEPLRDVKNFAETSVARVPEVRVTHAPDAADPVLRVTVENRGGGIGPVQVLINGKEVTADARPPGSKPHAPNMELSLNLDGNALFRPDADNQIDVVAANADQSLTSRGAGVTVIRRSAPGTGRPAAPPNIWAVAVGISEYRGDQIDLNFAQKDAASFADALRVAATGLVPPDRVHITVLGDGSHPATRASIREAFRNIGAQATSSDILVLYMAGHGVTWGTGTNADYYYLLQDAESLDVTDAAVRAQVTLSSQELTDFIKDVPALKQVLILDTCASGQIVSDLVKSRGVSAGQMRSIERMKDRTGMFVLAGSAADAVSYEASPYGQGLLTYSLLTGMRGAALRDDEFVDVDTLFGFATDEVQRLASRLGGIQQPRVGVPSGGESFDIGRLSSEDRTRIHVAAPKPIVISTNFQDERRMLDDLLLGERIDRALRDAASKQGAGFVFFGTRNFPDAYQVAGRYTVNGDQISVNVAVYRGKDEVTRFQKQGSLNDLPALDAELVGSVEGLFR